MNISKIAQLSEVSKSTVSRYLNKGYVSEENRKKIQTVIDETGYIPSSYAQTLRTKKTNLIGVILPKISSETISRIVDGISSEISHHGYNVLLGNTELSIEKEIEYLNIFKNNEVDGIIFVATVITQKHLDIMKNIKTPIVVVGQNVEDYSCVYHDDYGATYSVVEKLIKDNYKQIGYIGIKDEDIAVGFERRRGYLEALRDNAISVNESIMKKGDFSAESGYEQCKNIFDTKANVEAIICATDNMAIGAMEYIKEINLNIPKDIGVVSIGDSKLSRVVTPKLSTVHYYYKTSGIEAAKVMIEKIKKENKNITKIRLGYEFKERESI
jgi:LacI family sucrose operon transcriptional repressor